MGSGRILPRAFTLTVHGRRVRVKSPRATRLPLYRQSQIFAREGIDLGRLYLSRIGWAARHCIAGTRLADANAVERMFWTIGDEQIFDRCTPSGEWC